MFTTKTAVDDGVTDYGYHRVINLPWKTAIARIKAALKGAGFSLFSEIDVAQKLKEKVGLDFDQYLILSVCNPPLAVRALQEAPDFGALLLCNLEIYEREGHVEVAEIDSTRQISVIDHPHLDRVIKHENEILRRVIDSI
jgi:uncharacterized protein (DUF302 family)